MSEKTESITVLRYGGQTLSSIIWRRFRRPMEGLLERTLDANPGLAKLGVVLPYGTTFDLVIPSPEETVKKVPVLRLWGRSS